MNRVWEIREGHKVDPSEWRNDYRGGSMRGKKTKMSGYKDVESYKAGYQEGYCDALDEVDKFLDEHSVM